MTWRAKPRGGGWSMPLYCAFSSRSRGSRPSRASPIARLLRLRSRGTVCSTRRPVTSSTRPWQAFFAAKFNNVSSRDPLRGASASQREALRRIARPGFHRGQAKLGAAAAPTGVRRVTFQGSRTKGPGCPGTLFAAVGRPSAALGEVRRRRVWRGYARRAGRVAQLDSDQISGLGAGVIRGVRRAERNNGRAGPHRW
jgi:hypothetical protein